MQVATVDLGNSHPHFCLFQDSQIHSLKPLPLNELRDYVSLETPIIVSNVRSNLDPVLEGYQVTELPAIQKMSFLDMPVNYSRSLGQDRLAQAYYLFKTMTVNEACLIDIGTFITVDYISKENGFEGGFILPGVDTFLNSYQSGAKLPILSRDQIDWNSKIQIPHNTYEAITEATKLYMKGLFASINASHVFLSGGDTAMARKFLTIDGITEDPHLIHQSLFYIFQSIYS